MPKGTYIIESGIIKTYAITANGEERIVAIDTAGDDIPIGFTIGLVDRSRYFYEAASRCRVRIVPRADFMKHIINDHQSLLHRHVRLTKILLTSLKHVEALEQSKATEKVAMTLLYFAETLGSTFPNSTTRRLSITQQEIADSLGVTRETTGSVLKKLELKKLLVRSRNTYVLYIDKLRKHVDKR